MIKKSKKLAFGLPDEPVVFCPGCDEIHVFNVNKPNRISGAQWSWDGDVESPTFSPSLVINGKVRCHSFLRNGVWEFLDDCTHSLAGKKVPLPDLPDWVTDW